MTAEEETAMRAELDALRRERLDLIRMGHGESLAAFRQAQLRTMEAIVALKSARHTLRQIRELANQIVAAAAGTPAGAAADAAARIGRHAHKEIRNAQVVLDDGDPVADERSAAVPLALRGYIVQLEGLLSEVAAAARLPEVCGPGRPADDTPLAAAAPAAAEALAVGTCRAAYHLLTRSPLDQAAAALTVAREGGTADTTELEPVAYTLTDPSSP